MINNKSIIFPVRVRLTLFRFYKTNAFKQSHDKLILPEIEKIAFQNVALHYCPDDAAE
ncbi:hypothetical protein Plhal304r1_c085g0168611 [Plasmopara halstedii]